MAKAAALDLEKWSTFDMVACALPAIGIVLGAIVGKPGPGFAIGVGVWALLAIRPRPVRNRKPKRDPETDPVEGDILKGYVYIGDETWEPVMVMPSIWWQFRASPREYNAAVRVLKEGTLDPEE
jgi:hypothetical protein